jgi:hypothetical protein
MTTTTTAGPPDARIIKTAHGFEVHPGVVPKRRSDSFTIRNMTAFMADVTFPEGLMTNSHGSIEPREPATFHVREDVHAGVYDYTIEVAVDPARREFKLQARGASSPRIIIDF